MRPKCRLPKCLAKGSKLRICLHKVCHLANNFMKEYWAHGLVIGLGSAISIALAIPFMSYLGLDCIAKPLFFAFHYLCAQTPSHSCYFYGHQCGLCTRCLAIYIMMFLGSLIFVLTKKRVPALPWWIWILMLLPIAWDGLTQMVGWRESTWMLRVVTGSLFGLGNVWFALPRMHESLQETPPLSRIPHRALARGMPSVRRHHDR